MRIIGLRFGEPFRLTGGVTISARKAGPGKVKLVISAVRGNKVERAEKPREAPR